MTRSSRTIAALAIALVAAPLVAQQQGKGPGQGGPPQGPPSGPPPLIMLVSQRSVQSELKLTPQQMQKLSGVLTQQHAAMWTIAPADRMTKMKDLNETNDKAVTEILQAEQNKRLKEISLQIQGSKAYSDPAIVKELELTMDQQLQIGAIEDTVRGQMGPPPQQGQQGKGPPPNPETMRKKMALAQKSAEEKIQKLLTDEQKAKWKELVGKPFTGAVRPGPPGGVGPPQ